MVEPLTTCKANSNPFPASLFLTPSVKPYPANEELIDLCSLLTQFIKIKDQETCNNIFEIISKIPNESAIQHDQLRQLCILKMQVACQRCETNPKNITRFPYHICDECYSNILNSPVPRCRHCLRVYKNSKYWIGCNHLCIFCLSFWISKGHTRCFECHLPYQDLKNTIMSKKFFCVGCNAEKQLYEDSTLKIECKHIHCYDCLYTCVKQRKCNKEEITLSGPQINFILHFISCRCVICKKRKNRKYFVQKLCCNDDICITCLGDRKRCMACLKFTEVN